MLNTFFQGGQKLCAGGDGPGYSDVQKLTRQVKMSPSLNLFSGCWRMMSDIWVAGI